MTTETAIPRTEAVDHLCDHLADHDAYIIIAPPACSIAFLQRLADLDIYTAWVDSGFADVLQTGAHAAEWARFMHLNGLRASVVAVIPKTVPVAAVEQILTFRLYADGSDDTMLLYCAGGAS
jgi:hypothetical protein